MVAKPIHHILFSHCCSFINSDFFFCLALVHENEWFPLLVFLISISISTFFSDSFAKISQLVGEMPTATPSGQNTWILCVFSTLEFAVFFKKVSFLFSFIFYGRTCTHFMSHPLWHFLLSEPSQIFVRLEASMTLKKEKRERHPGHRHSALTWLVIWLFFGELPIVCTCSPLPSVCLNSLRLPCLVPECLSVGQSPKPVHTAHVRSHRDRHMEAFDPRDQWFFWVCDFYSLV